MSSPVTRSQTLALANQPQPIEPNSFDLIPLDVHVHITYFLTLGQALKLVNVNQSWRAAASVFIVSRIKNTESICYEELEAFRNACVEYYLRRKPRIGTLLDKFEKLQTFVLGNTKITLAQLGALGKALWNVKTIDASGQETLNENRIRALLSNCKDLDTLSLASSRGVTGQMMSPIIRRCPAMKELNLTKTSICDSALAILSVDCKNLKRLHIVECTNITAEGLSHMAGTSVEVIQ